MQKPSVGRIVHYQHTLGENRFATYPAIVVDVLPDNHVALKVFSARDFFLPDVSPSESLAVGCWSWPARVE